MKLAYAFVGVCVIYTLWTSTRMVLHHHPPCNCPPQLNISFNTPSNRSNENNCLNMEQQNINDSFFKDSEDSPGFENGTDIDTPTTTTPSNFSDIPPPTYPPLLFESGPDIESKTAKHICTYFSSNTNLPQSERISTLQSLLEILTSTYEAYNIEHWLASGTLLGSFRDQKIIPWDQDADIGITFESVTTILSRFSSLDFQWPCTDCTMIVRQGHHAHVIPFKFVNTTNGVYVDSFLFLRKDIPIPKKKPKKQFAFFWPEGCAFCKDGSLMFDYDVVFPLNKSCVLENHLYFCPNQPEAFLLRLYKHLRPTPPKGWNKPTVSTTLPSEKVSSQEEIPQLPV